MDVLKYGEKSVSLSIEEGEPKEWTEKVYKPDILENLENVYQKPGYNSLEKWGTRYEHIF